LAVRLFRCWPATGPALTPLGGQPARNGPGAASYRVTLCETGLIWTPIADSDATQLLLNRYIRGPPASVSDRVSAP